MPASAGAAVFSPGTNLQMSRVRAPHFSKRVSVRRTQESGSSAMRQSRLRTTAPRRLPKWYQKMSALRHAAAAVSSTRGRLMRPLSGKSSGGEQQRRGRNRQATLLDQNPAKEQEIAVLHHELERLGHAIVGKNYPELLDAMLPQEGSAFAQYIAVTGLVTCAVAMGTAA